MSSSPLSGVTEAFSGVTDTVSSGAASVTDLAATAADLAAELAAELPDRVGGVARHLRDRLDRSPQRSWRPWVLVAIGVTALAATMWWLRRRTNAEPAVDIGPDGRPNPVRSQQDAAQDRSRSVTAPADGDADAGPDQGVWRRRRRVHHRP